MKPITALACLGLLLVPAARADVESGPKAGEKVPALKAFGVVGTVESKEADRIDDRFLALADIAAKARRQVLSLVTDLLDDRMEPEPAQRLADLLAGGYFTHDFPITVERAHELGLPVSTDLPEMVYELMALFPQPTRGRPSVTYLPLPAPEPGPGRMPPPRVG